MTIVDILKERSAWTYNIMAASANMGEMIREDAITSVNLPMIQSMADDEGINLSTTSLQGAHLEKEFGGDWIWNYNGFTLLIQAKKLDAIKNQKFMSYKIDIEQLKLLLSCCDTGYFAKEKASPFYVFYNTFVDGTPEDVGCTMINAKTLWGVICANNQADQASAVVSPAQLDTAGAGPWWQPFQ
jgi:hypothetical protein